MPGVALTLNDELTPFFKALGIHVNHPGELTSAFAAHLLYSTQRRFETETAPNGEKWKPLAKRTTLKKVRGGVRGTANILRVTPRLYPSIVAHSDATSAEVGSNVEYARIHQLGGEIIHFARSQRASFKKVRKKWSFVKRGRKGAIEKNITIGEHTIQIPARPYLGFSKDDEAALISIGEDWLMQEGAR